MEAFTQQAEVEVGVRPDIAIGSTPQVGVIIPPRQRPQWGIPLRTILVQAEHTAERRLMEQVEEPWLNTNPHRVATNFTIRHRHPYRCIQAPRILIPFRIHRSNIGKNL